MTDHTSTETEEERRLESQTDEGAQLLRPLTGEAREREVVLTGGPWPDADDTMIINMGPQHPSTHGVLRIMMEIDGETVLRAKAVVGYLHTGMEKTGEELTYVQGATNVTRMDYASPLSNELVYSTAVEQLLGIEVPDRAVWIRMMMVELNRISSHLLFQASNGMDLGAVSMMIYGWREREVTLRLLETITGLRMNHNYIRPGGVAADLPDNWEILKRQPVFRVQHLDPRHSSPYTWRPSTGRLRSRALAVHRGCGVRPTAGSPGSSPLGRRNAEPNRSLWFRGCAATAAQA
jgi:hypothetical protein